MKCKSYGVSCEYESHKSTLYLAAEGCFQVDLTSSAPIEQIMSFDTVTSSQLHDTSNSFGRVSGPEDLIVITTPFETMSNSWTESNLGTPWSPISINAAITATMNGSLRLGSSSMDLHSGARSLPSFSSSSWQFSEAHLAILNRFQTRTALTIGGKCFHIICAYKIACE
jgi:hypothetical protein